MALRRRHATHDAGPRSPAARVGRREKVKARHGRLGMPPAGAAKYRASA